MGMFELTVETTLYTTERQMAKQKRIIHNLLLVGSGGSLLCKGSQVSEITFPRINDLDIMRDASGGIGPDINDLVVKGGNLRDSVSRLVSSSVCTES